MSFLTRLLLTLDKRNFIPRAWIYPVLTWESKAYFPTASFVSQMRLVHKVLLGTNSWGITAKQLLQDVDKGGQILLTTGAFLWYHEALCVSIGSISHRISVVSISGYKGNRIGV